MESAVKTNSRYLVGLTFFICFILSSLVIDSHADTAGPMKTVSILPFDTNSQSDISYAKAGILSMLHSRLYWRGNVETIKPDITNQILAQEPLKNEQNILNIGKKAGADVVIAGVITSFSGAFSVDTKVYNLNDKTVLTFFSQSKTIDGLVASVDVIAAKINKKVFDRTTVSYEKFKKDKVITEEELRRMNPEKMMPQRRIMEEEDKPWWKVW